MCDPKVASSIVSFVQTNLFKTLFLCEGLYSRVGYYVTLATMSRWLFWHRLFCHVGYFGIGYHGIGYYGIGYYDLEYSDMQPIYFAIFENQFNFN